MVTSCDWSEAEWHSGHAGWVCEVPAVPLEEGQQIGEERALMCVPLITRGVSVHADCTEGV